MSDRRLPDAADVALGCLLSVGIVATIVNLSIAVMLVGWVLGWWSLA
jgi:hypothetical protein